MKPQKARQIIPEIILLVAAALLAGCGTTLPATQTVYGPVSTPCVKDEPLALVYEFDKLPVDASAGAKVLALARDWPRGRKHEGELEAMLAGCVQDTLQ